MRENRPIPPCVALLALLGVTALSMPVRAADHDKAKPDKAKLEAARADLARRFTADVQPLLSKFCVECHNAERKKGELDLARFLGPAGGDKAAAALDTMREVKARVYAHEMPPEGKPQFNDEQRAVLNRWMESLPREQINCQELATDRTQNFYHGYVMSRRLNRTEYNNSVRDLVGLDLQPGAGFPADGSGGEGFDTAGAALFTSPILLEKYLDAADLVARAVLPAGPSPFPPQVEAARRRLLVATPGPQTPPREAARAVLAAFARRAYRRPVVPAEVERLLTLYDRASNASAPAPGSRPASATTLTGDPSAAFEAGLRHALKAVLISPHFLFLVEPEPAVEGVHRLGAPQIASRLSYFLWSSIPDEELLTLAETGKLLDDGVMRAQVRRMLKDPKSRALGDSFAVQWLGLEPLGVTVKPDAGRFPEFDPALAAAMRAEAAALFHHIVSEDRPLTDLIDCDYTFVNRRLAEHYGMKADAAPVGGGWAKVALADRRRGGVLGLAGVHTVSSFPLRTSPVLRGRWVLEELLGERVPPPPPGTPTLPTTDDAGQGRSFRQQLEKHRTNPECAACHARMDPLGFGLENFDPVGRFRERHAGEPIDASGALPGGERFSGPVELKALLVRRKEQVIAHLARKMYGYAMGRELNKFDPCVIDDAMKALRARDHRAWSLVEAIVMSYPFQHRYTKK